MLLLYCCTSIDINADGRRGKSEKYVIVTTLDPNPTQTLIGILWGGQCLDAVACECSRLIRSIWLLCAERLLSQFGRLDAVGWKSYVRTTVSVSYTHLTLPTKA